MSFIEKVTFSQFAIWLICAYIALALTEKVWNFILRVRGGKGAQMVQLTAQPLQVQHFSPPITQAQFDTYKQEQEAKLLTFRLEVSKEFADLNKSREKAHDELHTHIKSAQASILEEVKRMDDRYHERMREGNERMNGHSVAIAKIQGRLEIETEGNA